MKIVRHYTKGIREEVDAQHPEASTHERKEVASLFSTGQAIEVSVAVRGSGEKLREPKPGEIIYVKATSGRYGKCCEFRKCSN